MTRDIFAYVSNILEARDSIDSILQGVSVEAYAQTREKRSAVEREFILIGEAVAMLVGRPLASGTSSPTTMHQ